MYMWLENRIMGKQTQVQNILLESEPHMNGRMYVNKLKGKT